MNDAPELTTTSADIDLGSVEEDLGYKGDEEDIIDQGTAALGLNPFVITEEQLLANFTDADDAIADLSVVNLIADSGTLTQHLKAGNSSHQKISLATSTSPSLSPTVRPSLQRQPSLLSPMSTTISMTIGAGLIPTSPAVRKTKRLRSLVSNCSIRSITTRTGMKKI